MTAALQNVRYSGMQPPPVPPNNPTLPTLTANAPRFTLFTDINCSSAAGKFGTYALSDFTSGSRHILKAPVINSASAVTWNFPKGVVVTLMQNQCDGKERDPGVVDASLAGAGYTYDLVGTGQQEVADLTKLGCNDVISAFFWRYVDLSMGSLELFKDANFAGNRVVLFFSEWSPFVLHSFDGWAFRACASSARWESLADVTAAALTTSKGFTFNGIKGWGSSKAISTFTDYEKFNNSVTGFKWLTLEPKKEIITPFAVPQAAILSGKSLSTVQSGCNATNEVQQVSVTLTKSDATTLSVTNETTSSIGFEASVAVSYMGASASFSVKRDLSKRTERSTSSQHSQDISITQTVNVSPKSNWTAQLVAEFGNMDDYAYATPVTRWYDVPVPNAVVDPSNNNWFKREEVYRGTVSGGIVTKVTHNVTSTPI